MASSRSRNENQGKQTTLLTQLFLKAKNFIQARPILTAAIRAGLIAAAIFSGGMALAAPAALLIMAQAGAIATAICTCVLGLILAYHKPRTGYDAGIHSLGTMGFLLGASAAYAAFFFPPLGLALCGIVAVAGSSSIAAACTGLFKKPIQPSDTLDTLDTSAAIEPPKEQSSSYARTTGQLPLIVANVQELTTPVADEQQTQALEPANEQAIHDPSTTSNHYPRL